MDVCRVPDCKELAVETHHIYEQQSADEKGMIEGRFHKNSSYNQAPLCKSHHQDVTFNRIQIPGWVKTADGGRILQIVNSPDESKKKNPKSKPIEQAQKQSQLASFWKK